MKKLEDERRAAKTSPLAGAGDSPTHSPFWDKRDPINPTFELYWRQGFGHEGTFKPGGYSGPHNKAPPSAQSRLWNGTGGGGYPHPAALSSVAANNRVMNNSSSNAFHVGDVHVNAPNATDSKGIADSIADALQLSLHAPLADYGQA
jgi:hypothetical protein